MDQALANAFTLLKPGGILGIVQHQAREDLSDEWASGDNGYLKKSFVIREAEKAGFKFVDESAVNENAKDQAKEGDIVWRLPPSYSTSKEDKELKAEMAQIGESHRMTLKFLKPENVSQ
jgi:predicted methyltransferase